MLKLFVIITVENTLGPFLVLSEYLQFPELHCAVMFKPIKVKAEVHRTSNSNSAEEVHDDKCLLQAKCDTILLLDVQVNLEIENYLCYAHAHITLKQLIPTKL